MDDNTVSITTTEYKRLISLEARVCALIAYVNRYKYAIERDIIGGILGFSVNEVSDGANRKQNVKEFGNDERSWR